MLERGSPAIEAARAAIGEAQAAAQRLRRLTQGGCEACEGLVTALHRWPSFAVADPWAIEAPMPVAAPSPESQATAKRIPSWVETPPAVAGRSTPGSLPGAAMSGSRAGTLSPHASRGGALQALAQASPSEPERVEALTESARSSASSTSTSAATPQASALAALVAQAIARHTAPELAQSDASSLPWSELLPAESVVPPKTESAPSRAAPSEPPAVLQAVDLPTRAALDNIARADSSQPASQPLAAAAALLQRLLPDAHPTEPTSATPTRVAAPRAPSRLLSAPAASATTPATRPATPAHLPSEEDDEAEADAVSRLLSDQAWLRGTDFT